MTERHYLHLHPTGTDASDAALTDEQIAAEGWWCRACRSPKSGVGAINIQIENRRPVNSPICFVLGFGIVLAKHDFLLSLGKVNVSRDLMLGEILGPDGTPIDGWVTVRARHEVIVRGTRSANYRCCGDCGRILYFAMPPNYLFPAPDPKIAILQSQLRGLVVPSEITEGLGLKRKRGFGIETLKILDAPRVGLGELKCP